MVCSFCGNPPSPGRELIAPRRRSTEFICNQCIGTCRKILDDVIVQSEARGKDSVDHTGTFARRTLSAPGQRLCCSFCGRPQEHVMRLIGSPHQLEDRIERAFICSRCVQESERVLQKDKDEDLRGRWGLAVWLKRAIWPDPVRLHRIR